MLAGAHGGYHPCNNGAHTPQTNLGPLDQSHGPGWHPVPLWLQLQQLDTESRMSAIVTASRGKMEEGNVFYDGLGKHQYPLFG